MKRVAVIAAALAAVAVTLAAILVLSTLARESGRVRAPGLRRPVLLELDGAGVPTVRGATVDDVFFGLGYVHARDRLWQMEFQRRVSAGRLAEVLGPGLLESDRFLRTIGFRRAAESALRNLSARSRQLFETYVAGINAFLAVRTSLPVEFRLLGARPEPFAAVDCLAWAKLMAWDLAGNAANEIRRARFIAAVGPQRAADLLPAAPEDPTILDESEWAPGTQRPAARAPVPPMRAAEREAWRRLEARFALLRGGDPESEATGSNSWVVSGARSRSGLPLLANDPHLGLRTPSVWYLARLEAPDFSARGATLPGVPGVIIGHNRRIAWGLTSLEPDVQDLYVEETDPGDPTRYRHRGAWLPFQTRTERIRVRGRPDDVLTVRSSVHGPIVTDVLGGAKELGPAVALRWTGLDPDDTTAEAFFRINGAGNWPEFLAAAALLRAPAQNFVYADVEGHIGYTATGALPLRSRGDGLFPVSGAGDAEWTGYVPFEGLPRVLDPPRGFIVTANNRVNPAQYGTFTGDWPEPYRAKRITDLMAASGRHGVEDFRRIQLDRISYQARELLPLLLDTEPPDEHSRELLDRLRKWSFDFSPDSTSASIYAAWYTALSAMPEDELGGTPPGNVRTRFLINALRSQSAWCDDARTKSVESCDAFKSETLKRAIAMLRERLGTDPDDWRWSRLHTARFPHGVFGGVPGLRKLFNVESGQGGDASTINVGAYRRDGSFVMGEGPSYRQIVDLSNLAKSLWVHAPGQTGNVFRSGYRGLIPAWRDGRYLETSSPPVKTLVLEPE
ncbi:MAG: penicillin acylase family protein [Thermoanaerobaculia bacterium]